MLEKPSTKLPTWYDGVGYTGAGELNCSRVRRDKYARKINCFGTFKAIQKAFHLVRLSLFIRLLAHVC